MSSTRASAAAVAARVAEGRESMLQERLARAQLKVEQQRRLLETLGQEYRATRAHLRKSQLANSMLRRLFAEQKQKNFHSWLRVLEFTRPGTFWGLLDGVYSWLGPVTCVRHRSVCRRLLETLPKHVVGLTVVDRSEHSGVRVNVHDGKSYRSTQDRLRRETSGPGVDEFSLALHPDFDADPLQNETDGAHTDAPKTTHDDLAGVGLNRLVGSLHVATAVRFSGFVNGQASGDMFVPGLCALAAPDAPHGACRIVSLDLSACSIGPRSCAALGAAQFPSLEILRLENNDVRSEGLAGLFGTGGGLGVRRLKVLRLPDNKLQQSETGGYSDRGLQVLGRALAGAGFARLEVLDLSRNRIDDGGARSLAEGLGNCVELRELYLQWSCAPLVDGGVEVGKGLRGGQFSIAVMRRRKAEAVGERRKQVRHGISDHGACCLARSLAMLVQSSPGQLAVLDLRGHRIGTRGCVALVQGVFGVGVRGTGEAPGAADPRSSNRTREQRQRQQRQRERARKQQQQQQEEQQRRRRTSRSPGMLLHLDGNTQKQLGRTDLKLHGNPEIGADAIAPVARSLGFEGTPFECKEQCQKAVGMFSRHLPEEDGYDDGQDFRLKVGAAKERRKSARKKSSTLPRIKRL